MDGSFKYIENLGQKLEADVKASKRPQRAQPAPEDIANAEQLIYAAQDLFANLLDSLGELTEEQDADATTITTSLRRARQLLASARRKLSRKEGR